MEKLPELETLLEHTKNNDLEILQSHKCSCLLCRHTIDAREVQDWISNEDGVSAICPECGMDALIGDASGLVFTKEELREINRKYFGEDYMERHPEAARTYCQRYREGKITNKVANELLYIQYLNVLSREGDPYATFDLATLLEFGSEFTEADPKTAFSYYAAQCLEGDGQAYTRMGVLCERGVLGKPDYRGAFECYSKAMAFGSANGLLHFADCYMHGTFVQKNPALAYGILSNFYPDCYSRFVAFTGKDPFAFASLCYRLGIIHQEGRGVDPSPFNAIRFFLMAETAYSLQIDANNDGDIQKEFDDCNKRIGELAMLLKYRRTEPTFDIDTFAETLTLNPFGNHGGFEGSSLNKIKYDRETETLTFETNFGLPQYITDAASLFCGFVGSPIFWRFNDVVEVKYPNTDGPITFNRVYGNGDEGFKFAMARDGQEEIVAEFVLGAPILEEVEPENVEEKGQA